MALLPKEKKQLKKIYYTGTIPNIHISYEGDEALSALSDDDVRLVIKNYLDLLQQNKQAQIDQTQALIDDMNS